MYVGKGLARLEDRRFLTGRGNYVDDIAPHGMTYATFFRSTHAHARLQKLDVEEELDRLDSHVAEARRVLTLREAVGRRLDFLLQEFNREANTLGSKSVDARTSAAAVELKVLIDQVREQVQNIE